MPAPQNKGRSACLRPLRRIRCFSAPPAGTKGERKAPPFASALSLSARPTPARKEEACTLCALPHPFQPAGLRPSAPPTLIFSITRIFFPLKEFSFLETIRFLCNYVSVVVFYLNFFRRHAMKSLFCFFLGLAFLPVSASAIEHLPPPHTPFK